MIMFCYITHVMLLYYTHCHVMLYNMICMLYNTGYFITDVMLYNT